MKYTKISAIIIIVFDFLFTEIKFTVYERVVRMSEVNAVQKAEMPEINAQAAIVVTQHEGKILLEKNAKQIMRPAIAQKILAAIITLEKCNPSDVITVSQTTIDVLTKRGGSPAMDLQAGENISVLDLVYSMMLASANDAMIALAEFISGDIDKFSRLIQEKAIAIGATDTKLTDDNGCFTTERFSTAYDMAIICRYCMTNRLFRQIVSTDKYTVPATNKSAERQLSNTNLLINSQNRRYRYETAIGIKNGYTVKAKACLACSALPPEGKYGEEILTIILGAENTKQMKYVFRDAVTLFDFTFDNFEALSGVKKEEQTAQSKDSIFTITEICDMVNTLQRNVGEAPVTTFAFGKQKITPGCAYFAENAEIAKKAVSEGASVIISEQTIPGLPCIVVANLQAAKERIASLVKSKLGSWSIGVLDCPDKINPTGMICQLVGERMKLTKSVAVDNNYDSILKALLSSTKKTDAAILGVSCMVEGNVEKAARTANFDVAILLSAIVSKNPRDLTKAELTQEKLKICEGMSEAGAIILNIDDKNLASIFTIPQDIITIGVDNRLADYYADEINITENKITFDIINGRERYPIELYSDDKHSVYQALATFALGEIMGIPAKQVIASIEKYRKTDGLNKVKNERGMYVLSDFESDASESVGAALKELCSSYIPETARRIAVFSDIGAGEEFETNMFKKVGALINKCSVDIAVCLGKTAAHIADTADLKKKSVIIFETKEALTEYLKLNLRDYDAVLFKASSDTGLDDVMTKVT